jgi:hypothetical protein
MKLAFPAPILDELRSKLLADSDLETCAIVYARPAGSRLVVVRYEVAPSYAYGERTSVSATLTPEYLLEVVTPLERTV